MNLKRIFFLLCLVCCSSAAFAQTTAFTFQGTLKAAGSPADGPYDMQFSLYDSEVVGAGVQKGMTQLPVSVAAGVFSVTLDFGAAVFDGAPRYIEVGVRPSGSADPYTLLAPRSVITSAPYAIQALNSQQLGGLPSSAYISTGSVGNAFIKNGSTLQTSTSFNIDGKGLIGTSLGIGTTPLAGVNFEVAGSARVAPGNGGSMSFGAPNGETGMTILAGAGRADLRFNGTMLKLVAGAAGGPPSQASGVWMGLDGRVSFGDANTYARVNVLNSTTAIYGESTGPDSSGVYGIGIDYGLTGEGGKYAVRALGSTTGVFARGNNYGVYGAGSTNTGGPLSGLTPGFGVFADGYLGVTMLGAGGNIALCLNASAQVSLCSSSLRYKTDLRAFDEGLGVVEQLRPVSFSWKADELRDVGFGAEDVAKINPLFVTYNKAGDIEGVKYDRLSVVFVNAFKEQQAQIRAQSEQIEAQSAQLVGDKLQIATLQAQFDRQQRQIERLQQAIEGNRQAAN